MPPDALASFANALEQMADSPDCCTAMGKKGRDLAESEFARNKVTDRWMDFVESVGGDGALARLNALNA